MSGAGRKGVGLYADGRSSGVWCSALNCTNSGRARPDLSFFRFPKDEERCAKWVENTRRDDLGSRTSAYLSRNCRLCANHFEKKHILWGNSAPRLTWNAVPTVFEFRDSPRGESRRKGMLVRRRGETGPTNDQQRKGIDAVDSTGSLDALAVNTIRVKITPIVENVVMTKMDTPVVDKPVVDAPVVDILETGMDNVDTVTMNTIAVDKGTCSVVTFTVDTPVVETPVVRADMSAVDTSVVDILTVDPLVVDTNSAARPLVVGRCRSDEESQLSSCPDDYQPSQESGETTGQASMDTDHSLKDFSMDDKTISAGIPPADMKTLEARVKHLESRLKQEQRKSKRLALARLHLYRLQSRVVCLENKLQKAKKSKTRSSLNNLIRSAGKHLDGPALSFFVTQLKMSNRGNKGRKWNEDDYTLASTLHRHSSKAYNFCRTIFALPTDESLRRWRAKNKQAQHGFDKSTISVPARCEITIIGGAKTDVCK